MQIEPALWTPSFGGEPQPTLRLTHRSMTLEVVPGRGAKIISLRQRPHDVEWLWQNPILPWSPIRAADDFVSHHDVGGWDECFPTVAPTVVGGRSWRDHGDLWWRPWQVTAADGRLHCRVEGEAYLFERTICPSGDGVRLEYRVENRSAEPLPYLWCAHPLLDLKVPLRIELLGRPPLRVGSAGPFGEMGSEHRWPWVENRPFDHVGKPSGSAVKLFVTPLRGQVVLRRPDGHALRLRWPRARLPVLGLWINEGGWSGKGDVPYFNLGVEPATGAPDDLAVALNEWDGARTLAPNAQARWWLDLDFDENE